MMTGPSVPRRGVVLHRDRGQVALPMLLLTLSVVVVATGVVFVLGRVLVDRAAAQAAADAAALAGAAGGRDAAAAIARSNGARLVRITESGSEVMIEVTLGWASAGARADRVVPP